MFQCGRHIQMNIREEQEKREHLIFSPYASFSDESRGRDRDEEPCPMRTIYQRDRDRIIHCKAFRRLKHKTQVFLAPEGDHYRTRLTHTLEVAQIARSIARALNLNEDLTEAIAALNENDFDGVVVLGETTRIEPAFLEEINSVFDAGIQAIQLRHITEKRSTRKQYFLALNEEITQALFGTGATRLGVSSALYGADMVLDLKWLKKNQKSRKSNLERRLVRQGIFVEYLEKVKVYSSDIRAPRYKVRFSKALRALPEAIFTAHWDYCNKILRWILPSRRTNLISIALIATALLCYDWSLSLKWWSLLYILMFIICLAIPDYLVRQKTKK